jgi:hypothetical protein
LYHDTLFDDHNRLARGFILAGFGWAVIKSTKEYVGNPKSFDFSEDEDNKDEDSNDEDKDVDVDGNNMDEDR